MPCTYNEVLVNLDSGPYFHFRAESGSKKSASYGSETMFLTNKDKFLTAIVQNATADSYLGDKHEQQSIRFVS
jgi:hypothetical protein